MAFDTQLAERITDVLARKEVPFENKKMFGGLCFMVDGKMCLGVVKEELMARIGPDRMEEALAKPGCREMDFTGRPMKGYVFVGAEGLEKDGDLERFVDWCLAFNPLAKASRKTKKA